MARTRKTTKQNTLFSWFGIIKDMISTIDPVKAAPKKEVPKFLIQLPAPEDEILSKSKWALNLREKDYIIPEKCVLLKGKPHKTYESFRMKPRKLETKICSIDLALSCKDTEAFSEVQNNTVMKQNVIIDSITSSISRVRMFREKSSQNLEILSSNKRRKTTKSNNKIKKWSKIKTIWFYSNKSTLSRNNRNKKDGWVIKIEIPKTRKFEVLRDEDIFGDQFEMYSNEDLEIENDCDTDDEEINKSTKLMNRRLNQIQNKFNDKEKANRAD